MINAILINICLVLGLLIGVPFLFIYLLSAINRNTKQQIANHFRTAGQLGFGFLGVIIHEASHLLMALVFGHHIDQFRLIRIPTSDNPALGYVHHTWNQRNFYQNMGNLFIGVAPIFGCCLATLGLASYTIPEVYQSLIAATQQSFNQMNFTLPEFSWISMPVFLIIAANICIGGFDLSPADYENASQGILQTVIFLVGLTIIISITPLEAGFSALLSHFTMIVLVISLFNLLISSLMNVIFRII